MNRTATTRKNGFTILQMIVTIAIIAVVTTFGVLGITTARAEFRLQNSARLFASYLEKARADSVRRHASPGSEGSVETFGPGTTTYAVTMDFGSGIVETRTFPLETGLSFDVVAKKVSFDWRGRIPASWVFQVFSSSLAKSLPVDVSGSGDITVGEQHFPDQLIPAIAIAAVSGDTITDPTAPPSGSPTPTPNPSASPTPTSSPTSTPTPVPTPTATPANNGNGNGGTGNGNGNGNNPTPTPTPIPTPTPSVTPTPMPQCVATLSPSTLSLSQSVTSLKTGTALLTLTNATGVRTLSAVQEGNGNSLITALSLVRLDGNGYSIISVTTKNGAGNRGVFVVDVTADPACGSTAKLTVSVSN